MARKKAYEEKIVKLILLKEGIYDLEENVIIKCPISIHGAGQTNTIIQGKGIVIEGTKEVLHFHPLSNFTHNLRTLQPTPIFSLPFVHLLSLLVLFAYSPLSLKDVKTFGLCGTRCGTHLSLTSECRAVNAWVLSQRQPTRKKQPQKKNVQNELSLAVLSR